MIVIVRMCLFLGAVFALWLEPIKTRVTHLFDQKSFPFRNLHGANKMAAGPQLAHVLGT